MSDNLYWLGKLEEVISWSLQHPIISATLILLAGLLAGLGSVLFVADTICFLMGREPLRWKRSKKTLSPKKKR